MTNVEVKACCARGGNCPFYHDYTDSGGWVLCSHPDYLCPGSQEGTRGRRRRLDVEYNEPPPSHCPGATPVVIEVKR